MRSGKIVASCSVSFLGTPITESWDAAQELAKNSCLSTEQQQIILKTLDASVRKQIESAKFDDFDLIYERLLQLVLPK